MAFLAPMELTINTLLQDGRNKIGISSDYHLFLK
jgi:hypothetical protein